MTNKEKFKEVFEKTFGFVPEDHFPCPEKCPEKFKDRFCDGCPYFKDFESKEYKEPEAKEDDFLFKAARIMDNLASTLRDHSPIKSKELFCLISVFMDVITNDHIPVDVDLAGVRMDLAKTIYTSWPHSVEYYRKEKKE